MKIIGETLDIASVMLYICNVIFRYFKIKLPGKEEHCFSFSFILHGIPFEMPHAGSPNSTPYHPKCHTLASEMAGIYPPKPWGFRENPKVWDSEVEGTDD